MSTREVKVALRADVAAYLASIRAAERATTGWADRAVADAARAQNALAGVGGPGAPAGGAGPAPRPPRTDDSGEQAAAARARADEARLAKQAEAMDTVGTAAAAMGASIAGGLLLSAKAAIDWESAWAGVTKTVDGTTEEMAGLEAELRGMAKTLPIAHTELAGVAEAAGQLGIKREDIAGFTKTMVDLGVSTNLSAEDAATAIAQMTNVMGTAPKDVGRLGSALVALGNAGASTEAEIMSMAARLSGAGKLVGATESGVLAMANAMASVGIEAELGGGSMSRTLLKIYSAVQDAGPALDSFAKTAGMSAKQFAAAFEADPMRAVGAFTEGLARIKTEGGNVVAALGEVKIKGTQDTQVLLRLAGAGDLLADSLDLGAQAWEKNSALSDEAGKRYATVAAKLEIAKNNIVDLAIQIGDVLLPVIAKMADGVSGVIDFIERMPGPVREVAVALAGITAATLLFGGALLLTVPRIAATRAALMTLAASSMWSRIALNFRIVSVLVGGPWVLAFMAAAAAIGALMLMNRKSKPPIDDLTAAIEADTGALGANTKAALANRLQKEGALDLAEKYGIKLVDLTDATLGNAEAQERVTAAIAAARAPFEAQIKALQDQRGATTDLAESQRIGYDLMKLQTSGGIADLDKLSNSMNTNAAAAKDALGETGQLARATEATGAAASDASAKEDQLNEALGRSAAKFAAAAGGTKRLGEGVKAMGDEAKVAKDDIKSLTDIIDGLFTQAFAAGRANDAYAKGINALTEQIKSSIEAGDKHATSLRGNSDAALANREAIRSQVEATQDIIVEYAKSGASAEEVATKTRDLKKDLEDQAVAAGLSRDGVKALTRVLGDVPDEVKILLTADPTPAQKAMSFFNQTQADWKAKWANDPVKFRADASAARAEISNFAAFVRTQLAAIPDERVAVGVYTKGALARGATPSETGFSIATPKSSSRAPAGKKAFAGSTGGPVSGPGGPRDDVIPAWLSNGEYVINAAATARHRGLLDAVNTGRYAGGGPVVQAYAAGGAVTRLLEHARPMARQTAAQVVVNAPGSTIDYGRLASAIVAGIGRGGLMVQLDGRVLGQVLGAQADRYARGG